MKVETLSDAASQTGLSATFEHIALLRSKHERLRESQIAAEEQFVHRVGQLHASGELDEAELISIYGAFAELAQPGFTYRWNAAISVTVKEIQDRRRHLRHTERNAPNMPDGTWRGTWPLEDSPVPVNGTPVVYLLYDETGQPCYLGSTEYLRGRLQCHGRDGKPFASWTASRCQDRDAAYELEEELLAGELPYLNKKRVRLGASTMPRFQTDDTFDDDPAVLRAGTAAMGLYYRCGVYVARHLLDGFVPAEVAVQYGTPEWAKRLTDAGLWEPAQGGHLMPLYFKHGNPTRDKVLADRKAKAERQQRWLEKQRNPRPDARRVSRPSTRQSHGASRDASEDDALPPSLTGRKGTRARAPRDGAGAASQPPLLAAVADQHPFRADSSGQTCADCGLLAGNQRHPQARPA